FLYIFYNQFCFFSYCHRNLPFILFTILTSISITGTSVKIPTIVASTAALVVPNNAIATAIASSIFVWDRHNVLHVNDA
ncbi:MAG: hypothetical protein ACLR4O_16085, partial [Lachnospiraceae bacterium]